MHPCMLCPDGCTHYFRQDLVLEDENLSIGDTFEKGQTFTIMQIQASCGHLVVLAVLRNGHTDLT